MNLFQLAAIQRWRFEGPQGQVLTVEDLCHIGKVEKGLVELDAIAIALNQKLEQKSLSFVREVSVEDALTKNQLDLVIEIIKLRKAAHEEMKKRQAKQLERARINAQILEAEDDALKGMSLDQLKARLAELED